MKKRYVLVGMTVMMLAVATCGQKKSEEKNEKQMEVEVENKESLAEEKDSEKEESKEKTDTSTKEETNDVNNDEKETSNKKEELVDGMRPTFKEAMDSYESFYEDYVALTKKYNENPSDMELMKKSFELMEKSVEVNEKFEAWDEDEMNDAELKYYLKVQARVLEKLADVQ